MKDERQTSLTDLFRRFFKLSLQIVSRYKTWADKCIKTYNEDGQDSKTAEFLRKSGTTKDLTRLEVSKVCFSSFHYCESRDTDTV